MLTISTNMPCVSDTHYIRLGVRGVYVNPSIVRENKMNYIIAYKQLFKDNFPP